MVPVHLLTGKSRINGFTTICLVNQQRQSKSVRYATLLRMVNWIAVIGFAMTAASRSGDVPYVEITELCTQ